MLFNFKHLKDIDSITLVDDSIEQIEQTLMELQSLKNTLETLGVAKGNTYLALSVAKEALLERRAMLCQLGETIEE